MEYLVRIARCLYKTVDIKDWRRRKGSINVRPLELNVIGLLETIRIHMKLFFRTCCLVNIDAVQKLIHNTTEEIHGIILSSNIGLSPRNAHYIQSVARWDRRMG